MANMQSTITLKFEEQTLTLPSRLVTRMLEKIFADTAEPTPAPVQTCAQAATLPAIGEAHAGGIYAGLTLLDNRVKALVLLPGDEELNWKDAITWAENQGGVLPSRMDQLVLLQNLKDQFKERAYWSGAQHAANSDSAWYQDFDDGHQLTGDISGKLRARSVRRLEI